ncbi:MAG: hypothetical protein LUQ34_01025 [Euryarchaeota archaeon]|nr:hypothetical protein [Euryarchaeota archaeon]
MLEDDVGCYYGVHFGCLCVARDPNCQLCAERLNNAVNYERHTEVRTIDTPRTENVQS